MRNFGLNDRIAIYGESISSGPEDRWKYEYSVQKCLESIQKYEVGRVLLTAIGNSPWTVWVQPEPKEHDAGAGSGRTVADAEFKQWAAGVTPKGQVYYLPGREKQVPFSDSSGFIAGKGTGADVTLDFTPHNWISEDANITPERVLVHELTHSLRMKKGQLLNRGALLSSGKCSKFDNQEEFFGILLENLFISEGQLKGQPTLKLRWFHGGFSELPPKLTDPQVYYGVPINKGLLRKFCKELRDFAQNLGDLTVCPFNPIKVCLQDIGSS
jgi:hypothetical protein